MKKDLTKAHIALLFSLYTTQFLGLGFFLEALIAILRQNGTSLENLGAIYMLGLFWVFRFLWAPFVDKIEFKKVGHYRGWIIIFQSFMVITLFLISLLDLLNDFESVIILIVFFAFFSASQDIALDALALKTVNKNQRATANALKVSGGLIGMVLGGGIGLILYSYLGWQYTMIIVALTTSISLVQIVFYKEPKREKPNPQNKLDFRQYIDFWKGVKKKKWLLLILIYPITISSAYALIAPMLVDLGWSLEKIGLIVNIIGYSMGVLASFGTSWLINRYGKKNILTIAAIGQTIGALSLLVLLNGYNSSFVVMFIVGFIFIFYTPSQVIMNTLMMDQSSKKSPAAQFAIQHSFYMFAGIFFSSISISLSGIFGYTNVIIVCSIIGLSAIYMARKVEDIIDTNEEG